MKRSFKANTVTVALLFSSSFLFRSARPLGAMLMIMPTLLLQIRSVRAFAGRPAFHRFAVRATTTSSPSSSSSSISVVTRKRRRQGLVDKELNWETFDYSNNPKEDVRFFEDQDDDDDEDESTTSLKPTWHDLDAATVEECISILEPYIRAERVERMASVFRERTSNIRFLFENPSNPSNVWACLRTLDSFGIQFVDVIVQADQYQGNAAIQQKRGMRTAMGSAQWLSVRTHASTRAALEHLRNEHGARIFASCLSPDAHDVRQLAWKNDDNDDDNENPIVIVMGNEERGISDEMKQAADVLFYLPMSGFAESFNLSVATAITCAHLSSSSSKKQNLLRPNLAPETQRQLLLKGIVNSIPKKKMSRALLHRHGIDLPHDLMGG